MLRDILTDGIDPFVGRIGDPVLIKEFILPAFFHAVIPVQVILIGYKLLRVSDLRAVYGRSHGIRFHPCRRVLLIDHIIDKGIGKVLESHIVFRTIFIGMEVAVCPDHLQYRLVAGIGTALIAFGIDIDRDLYLNGGTRQVITVDHGTAVPI